MKLSRLMGMSAVLASSLALSGCLAGEVFHNAVSFASDVVDVGVGAVGVAGAVAGSRTTYTAPHVSTATRTSTSTITGTGYSQKGAFDDCAALYAAHGDAAGAAKCRARSTNMGSIQ